MTTIRNVIRRAMRIAGILNGVADMDAGMASDGLDTYNDMVAALLGNGVGPRLTPQAAAIDTQAQNGRLYQVGAAALTLTMPSQPRDGDRVGLADAYNALASNPVTVAPNGQLIEGSAADLVLDQSGTDVAWFFRADKGNWVLEHVQTLDEEPFLAPAVTEALTWMLTGRLATEYGVPVTETMNALDDQGRNILARRYGRRARLQTDPAPAGMPTANARTRGV